MNIVTKLKALLQLVDFKDIVGDDGCILPPSSNLYKQLSLALDSTIKPKYIYTILKCNRHNVYKDLLIFRNIEIQDSTTDDITSTTINTLNNSHTISFSLNVTDIWSQISNENVQYNFKNRGKRNMRTLRRYAWTSILYDRLFNETKLPCPLSFKCAKISESGIFLTVTGKCVECKCDFIGKIFNEPHEKDSVVMECTIHGYDSTVKHKKKRQLKGLERKQVAHKLVEGKTLPCIWRREQADILMDVGDDEPAHLYTGDVLRKAKQERSDKLLGVTSTNIFQSLWLMKYSSRFEGAIRFIGLDPLVVHYWSREQFAVYEKYSATLYIDATGSLIKKLKLPNGELCSHIYLYQAVAQVDENTAPVFQMISASQNTNTIVFWLQEFLRTGATQNSTFPSPKEVVTDFDKALLGAVARAFAKCITLNDYLSTCFALLNGAKLCIPSCFMRLDICHFMNMIARWKCFSGKPPLVRVFFLRAIAVLRKQNLFYEFEEIARNILILAVSPYQSPNSLAEREHGII